MRPISIMHVLKRRRSLNVFNPSENSCWAALSRYSRLPLANAVAATFVDTEHFLANSIVDSHTFAAKI